MNDTPSPTGDVAGTASQLNWTDVWAEVAAVLAGHVTAGRRHLLTEDVVRFTTVLVLADRNVTADRLSVERTLPGVGRIDLIVDTPADVAVEFKFPREPKETNAASTMTFGELLKDFYRVAMLGPAQGWVVQLYRPSLARYLAARTELEWTVEPGSTLALPAGLSDRLPATAQRALGPVAAGPVRARCEVAAPVGDEVLAAYRIVADAETTPSPAV